MTPLDKLNAIEEALRNLLYVFGTDDNDKPLPLDKRKTLGCIVDGYGAKALIPQLRQEIERLTAEPSEAELERIRKKPNYAFRGLFNNTGNPDWDQVRREGNNVTD